MKHHFIPRFYLSNFTQSEEKDAKLWITDQKQCKQWMASPFSVAFENGLYSLENTPENDFPEPDLIETAFAKVESMVAPILKEIIYRERLPSGDGFNLLINFIAMMATRTPAMINHRAKPFTEISQRIMEMSLSSEEHWQSIITRMRKEGKLESDENIDYQEMRDFIDNGNYSFELNQNFKIRQLYESIDILIPLLAARKWSLLMSKDITTVYPRVGGFICSDNPVALVSLHKQPAFFGPGFGMLGTEVTMPISKNMAIIGRFEGKGGHEVMSLSGLAAINSRTGMYADRFLYHSNKNYIMINHHQQICSVQDLLDYRRQM